MFLQQNLDQDATNLGNIVATTGLEGRPSGDYVFVSPRELRALCRGFANSLLVHAATGHDLELHGRELECLAIMSDALA